MATGYVKLWRQIEENKELWQNDRAYACFTKLFLIVNRNTGVYESGMKPLSERLGNWSLNTTKRALKELKDLGCIEIETTQKATKIKVINFVGFQKNKVSKIDTAGCQKLTPKEQPRGSKIDTPPSQNLTPSISKIDTLKPSLHKEVRVIDLNGETIEKLKDKETIIAPKVAKNEKEKTLILGEFKNIKLSEKEVLKLYKDFGEEKTKKALEYLSGYKREKGYKTKDDNLTLRRWVFDAVNKKFYGGSNDRSTGHNRATPGKYSD
jgi:DNA-binding transcriptional regulator YhcF (GntR family)